MRTTESWLSGDCVLPEIMALCGFPADGRRPCFFVWLHNLAENVPITTIDSLSLSPLEQQSISVIFRPAPTFLAGLLPC
jgi:hypothetical protein